MNMNSNSNNGVGLCMHDPSIYRAMSSTERVVHGGAERRLTVMLRYFALCYCVNVLEAARDKVDENWVTVFQDGSQVLGARTTLATFAVGDATWIALGIYTYNHSHCTWT